MAPVIGDHWRTCLARREMDERLRAAIREPGSRAIEQHFGARLSWDIQTSILSLSLPRIPALIMAAYSVCRIQSSSRVRCNRTLRKINIPPE
jgi:hypothetical protein